MNFNNFDDVLNMLTIDIDLIGQTCGLKHSREDPSENHPATNYLCQRLGDKELNIAYQEIRIPICAECAEALLDENWILAYCTFCHESQWIYRPLAKIKHPEGNGVYFMDVCPHCAKVVNEWEESKDFNIN